MISMRFVLALAVLVLARPLASQETRGEDLLARTAKLASGSAKDATALLLFLEDARWSEPRTWEALLLRRDDPGFLARVVRGLGRVAEPGLKPLLVKVLDAAETPWTPEVSRAAALAVGLFGDPELVPKLAAKAGPRDVAFALGVLRKLPAKGVDLPAALEKAAGESRPAGEAGDLTFLDPVVAALRWGAVIEEPLFKDLAVRSIGAPQHRLAAVDYFARSKAKAPAGARPALQGSLSADDPELAGLAARALAKSEGAGASEAGAIEAAFAASSSTIARADFARALTALQTPMAFEALAHMVAFSKTDPMARRAVLESLKAVAAKLPEPAKRAVAAAAIGIAEPEEGEPPAPADVRAAAVSLLAAVDPAQFEARFPAFRLSAAWPVRAAAAAALAGGGQLERIKTALKDPDRRVRIAMLEALAEKPTPPPSDRLSEVLEVMFDRRSASPNHWNIPRTRDIVEIGTLASAIGAGDMNRAALFFEAFRLDPWQEDLLPEHEVEPLQSILDLAAKLKTDRGNEFLRTWLGSSEISLRKRAKDLLAKNGIEAKEEPPRDDAAQGRLLDAAIARASLLDNPFVSAVIETNRGSITVMLFPREAPGTVENFLKLAKSGFYDGILWHRVVPAFVAQAGCPRGDGWGGPGYTIRCEINDLTYRRGSVGMALAGKDTGGSQFFICHRALPHLDGRYTLFGQVTAGMDVVDKLGQDDYIIRVREQ